MNVAKNRLARSLLISASLVFLAINAVANSVSNDQIEIEIDSQGQVFRVNDVTRGASIAFSEYTQIGDLSLRNINVETHDDNRITITMQCVDTRGDRQCRIRKTVTASRDSIRFDVTIEGTNFAWSAPIQTRFELGNASGARFWTAWGLDGSAQDIYDLDGNIIVENNEKKEVAWHDPLVSRAFEDLELWYGSRKADKYRKGFSLPLASISLPDKGKSINIAFSPEDPTIKLRLNTSKKGALAFTRLNDRISSENTVAFSYDIFLSEDDWRPALGWLTRRYPNFFEPSLERTHDIAGTSSYSGYNGEIDTDKFSFIAYGFNWYASRSWPYLGMFLPPVKDGESWTSWSGKGSGMTTTGKATSFSQINADYKQMHERGFHMLAYFNLNEFGYRITFPLNKDEGNRHDSHLWKDGQKLLEKRLYPSVLYTEDHRARTSWNNSVVMDPGHPIYHSQLLDHAQRHIDKVPNFDGMAIDRLDWFEWFNYRRDDGISMVAGKITSAMTTSFHEIMSPLADLMHAHEKVIYYNPHLTRLDFNQYFDGIFDEFADSGDKISLSALLALKMPIIGWIHNEEILRKNPDGLIQRYLYLGAYPMAPYPEANHSLETSEWANNLFADYGLMFQALKGKEWVFEPHMAAIAKGLAKVNIFKTHEGVIVPIMLGENNATVKLAIKPIGPLIQSEDYTCQIAYPGGKKWTTFDYKKGPEKQTIEVPLKRGCAMLRFKK